SSALDYATDKALRKGIKGLSKEGITFIVSQRVSAISDADKILVLENGILVGMGTHEELLANCEVYKEIVSSQNREGLGDE
ncbi:MAG: ABC transporter ATP-binding protein, partial [Clostridia bacterium]|nr:ABC transporter ATP-binding protein [Clostridia bacterium]